MIKTQIIKEDNKPKIVLLDYEEFIRLKQAEEDRDDYYAALEIKFTNTKWIKHEDIKKDIGIEYTGRD